MIKNFKVYALITILVAIILTAVSTASLFLSYDAEIGYFKLSAITIIRDVLHVLTVIAFIILAFSIEKSKYKALRKPTSLPFQCTAYVCSIMYICAGALIYISSNIANPRLNAITLMLTLISALFFISMTSKKENFGSSLALFSIVIALCSTAVLISVYFNMKITMNSHNKLLSSAVLMSSMIAFLLDARIHLNRQLPRLYLLFLMVTGTLGSSFVLSRMIYVISSSLSAFERIPLILENYGFMAIIFASAIYSISRIPTFYNTNEFKDAVYNNVENVLSGAQNEKTNSEEK